MGMFDDLIPAPKGGGGGGGMFDDLIPKAPGEDVTAGMALRGIPVLGAYVPQAEAAIRAAAQPLTGVGEPGSTYAERYAKNLPLREADYAKAEREQPIESTALQIGGGAAALAPIGATALGARALGAAGPMIARPFAGLASGAGIAAADAAARGQDVGTAAAIGGGIGAAVPVIGGAVGKIGQVARSYRGAPTGAELSTATDAGYTAARNAGVEINPTYVSQGLDRIAQDLTTGPNARAPRLIKETLGLLSDEAEALAPSVAKAPGAMAPLTGVTPAAAAAKAPVDFNRLDALRRNLGEIARDYSKPTEQAVARQAQSAIDDLLENAARTKGAVLKGDAGVLATTAREARGNAAAEFRVRALDALRQRAEDQAGSAASGMNVENAYRQQLRAFIRPNNKGISPAKSEGFTDQEINRLRVATRGLSFPNMLRLVGNALGGGHGLVAAGGAGASYATGDPRYLAAVGAGYGMRRMSNALMRNRAEMLGRMAASRSPLAQQMGVGGPGLPLNVGPAQAGLLQLLPPRAIAGRQAGAEAENRQPQFAGPQMPFRPGEQMDNLMASVNGPQGYPDFHWVNPAGVDAMLEHSPMSTNIEDRRDELGGFAAAAARMRRQGRRP